MHASEHTVDPDYTPQLGGMSPAEEKHLLSKWSKGSYDSIIESVIDHANRHGFANKYAQYLRKAAAFNKRGAKKKKLDDGAIRWNRKNGEFIIERGGKIVSYGINK